MSSSMNSIEIDARLSRSGTAFASTLYSWRSTAIFSRASVIILTQTQISSRAKGACMNFVTIAADEGGFGLSGCPISTFVSCLPVSIDTMLIRLKCLYVNDKVNFSV